VAVGDRGRVPSFARLKTLVTLEQVLAARGLLDSLVPRGHTLVGPCPVHGGDNPRAFVVDRRRQLWNCFTACGGGDLIELVHRLDRVRHGDVARILAACLDRPAPRLPPPTPRRTRAFRPFTAALSLDPEAPFLHRKGIRADTARRFEAGAWYGGGMLAGCVAVRLRDPAGRPLGYAGRRLDTRQARRRGKWVLPPALPKREILYGWSRVANAGDRRVVIVEGPWGVMRLAQISVPAVALLGVAVSRTQAELLRSAGTVVLMLDGDNAGVGAATRLAAPLDADVVRLPDGCDPDDMSDAQLRALLAEPPSL